VLAIAAFDIQSPYRELLNRSLSPPRSVIHTESYDRLSGGRIAERHFGEPQPSPLMLPSTGVVKPIAKAAVLAMKEGFQTG